MWIILVLLLLSSIHAFAQDDYWMPLTRMDSTFFIRKSFYEQLYDPPSIMLDDISDGNTRLSTYLGNTARTMVITTKYYKGIPWWFMDFEHQFGNLTTWLIYVAERYDADTVLRVENLHYEPDSMSANVILADYERKRLMPCRVIIKLKHDSMEVFILEILLKKTELYIFRHSILDHIQSQFKFGD
ncbi:MAG: hypothetical protein EAZ57_11480 [Cytophagales bacterium]|nr:MAG: hypothetical protein EAZ67_12415 [Cytophagales bacterium]TAF59382.1 MAG: hypothetical protein EAZ57_11480 [Cytophagales bacterium]